MRPCSQGIVFAGDMLIGEIRNTSPYAAYTWGPDGIVSRRDLVGNTSAWYEFGPQGETRTLTNSSGAVSDTYYYNAYGETISSSGTTVNPFKYGGKFGYYTESFTSLILATQRWYAPQLMRWINRDPIGYKGGENLYSYVGGSPVRWVDPEGLAPFGNGSNRDIRIKPENGWLSPPNYCPPYSSCDVDGVLPNLKDECSLPIKIPDNCKGVVTEDGKLIIRCGSYKGIPAWIILLLRKPGPFRYNPTKPEPDWLL